MDAGKVMQPPSQDQESLTTVLIALGANLLIAVAKTAAAMLSSSASMVAEAAHSWADTANEVLLLIADRSGRLHRDEIHPLGYGRDSYVWSMFAAFGLFTAGAVVSIMHGVQELLAREAGGHFVINYIVLGIAFVLEGISFIQAFTHARGSARGVGSDTTLEFVLDTSNPTLRAVFFEDSTALIGLVIAGIGILTHQLTGSPVPDALGSIAVGILLGVIAVVLIQRNRNFLLGQQIGPQLRRAVLSELLDHPDVERITYLHVEFVGPSRVYLVAAVDLTGDQREHDLAVRLRKVERDIERYAVVEEAVLTLSTQDEPSLDLKD